MTKLLSTMVALLCVIGLQPAAAVAQTAGSGNIEGVVTDATGGVLPGVTVIVRNLDTNVTREAATDQGGRYRAALLQPGRYEVTAVMTGFTATPITEIAVQVGQTTPIDVRMRPEGVAETITVSG
ncbi:MAG: carboxypeptidase-like regulatory domain-containing protein, partial [Vicinamibacterales bacterium]